jgi:hypothetical protein
MSDIRVVSDPDECRHLWKAVIPAQYVSDIWEVRNCFQKHYNRPLHFIVAEDGGRISGLLPLSRIEETGSYGYFPGEVWHGKTWLEQNRIFAADRQVFDEMYAFLKRSRARFHLRYLLPSEALPQIESRVDETGYLFHPPDFGYNMENYFRLFSGKSIKRIKKEIADFEARSLSVRVDHMDDFDLMVRMNLDRFGDSSYFSDSQFTAAFRDLSHYFDKQGWLRFTTVLIDGEPAAVDMGCIYRDVYTLMAGGTDGRFPGIAKLINMHHMRRACDEKLAGVDFLCGDFSWKPMFHLSPRPLYLISNMVPDEPRPIPARPSPAFADYPQPSLGSALNA